MAEQPHSQPQQIFADFWTKAFQDHIARVEAFYAEVGKLEAKGAITNGLYGAIAVAPCLTRR